MDDEGRWIESKRMLRELQAPHTSRAQLRQWCLLLVKEKAWWQSKQCGLAPSSIQGRAAIFRIIRVRAGRSQMQAPQGVTASRRESIFEQRKRSDCFSISGTSATAIGPAGASFACFCKLETA